MSNLSTNPSLSMVNGTPVVSTLDIAEHFDKKHKNVLQAIDRLEIDEEFAELNFQPSEYIDKTGRTLPAYNLTRDGFSLLVMGFTGKKASEWKVRYIEAFNAMEQELINRQPEPAQPVLTESTPADRRPLRDAVEKWVRSRYSKVNNSHFREAWSEVNSFMQVESIKDIPCEHLYLAVEFVERQIALDGETADTPRLDSPTNALGMNASPAPEVMDMSAAECVDSAKFYLLRATYLAGGDAIRHLFYAYEAVNDAGDFLKGEGRHAKEVENV